MTSIRTSRRGFTLIELLVVIAIIALIAAILFPVFASAREKARQATCLSNLKQIGLTFSQYEQDSDECPPSGGGTGYYGTYWTSQVYPYISSMAGVRSTLGTGGQGNIFLCPDDNGAPTVPQSGTSTQKPDICSYGMNTSTLEASNNASGFSRSLYVFPLSSYTAPANTVLLFEVVNSAGYGLSVAATSADSPAAPIGNGTASPAGANQYSSNGNSYTNNGGALEYATGTFAVSAAILNSMGAGAFAPPRHSGGATYLLADGHAKWFAPTSVCPGYNNPSPNSCAQTGPGQANAFYAVGTGCPTYHATFSVL